MLKNHKYKVTVAQLKQFSYLQLSVEDIQGEKFSEQTCNICGIYEDETHVLHCLLHKRERDIIFSNISKFHPGFSDLHLCSSWETQIDNS